MRKNIRDHILLERIKGQTDPSIAYELLTTAKQLHKKEKEELEDMLLGDLVLAYTYKVKRKQYWPGFDAAVQQTAKDDDRQVSMILLLSVLRHYDKNNNNAETKTQRH